jgi:hypothetical protein
MIDFSGLPLTEGARRLHGEKECFTGLFNVVKIAEAVFHRKVEIGFNLVEVGSRRGFASQQISGEGEKNGALC